MVRNRDVLYGYCRMRGYTMANGIINHGTYTAYIDGCRCEHCREAGREYRRKERERNENPEYMFWFPFHFEWDGIKWVRVDD